MTSGKPIMHVMYGLASTIPQSSALSVMYGWQRATQSKENHSAALNIKWGIYYASAGRRVAQEC